MLNRKRGPRAVNGRRNQAVLLQPEALEGRLLMAIDLNNVATQPFGVQEVGFQAGGGVGFKVTDVGDVNGDSYDDFVVGAPTALRNGNNVSLGNGANARAFLILGSKSVNAGNIDYKSLTTDQRIGDLAVLGNTTQANPVTGNASLSYAGVTFTSTLSGSNTQLGASVTALGDINGSGLNSFMIGAPGATDANGNNVGTGKAYIVYGSRNFGTSTTNLSFDLDNPLTYQSPVLTLVTNNVGAKLGFSGAGVGDVITDSFPDIAIGAPGATVNGLPNSGAAFLLSGTVVRNARSGTLNVDTIGQTNGLPGVIFTGVNLGDQLGYSVAGGFDFNGAKTTANQTIDDLVIGAPQIGTGAGYAAMVYGQINLPGLATTTNNVTSINVSRVGSAATTGSVPGIFINGAAGGDETGFAVSAAGDFNADGLGDFLIGSPFANSPASNVAGGTATLLEGVASGPVGTLSLSSIPATLPSIVFGGSLPGALAGYSLTQVGRINNDNLNEIAIGSPGFNAGSGAVYLVPGNADIAGAYTLVDDGNTPTGPLFARQFLVSGSVGPAFLGASVSGRLTQLGQTRTLDNDLIADLIIGSPGYSLPNAGTNPPTTSRNLAGAVFAIEGALIPLDVPVSTAITTTIGVAQPVGPFTIDATNPATLTIFVFSNPSANFKPVTDINPATIVVNGVAFANAKVSADPVDENKDGIPDAIVTITPRTNLALPTGTVTITISGRTSAGSGNRRFTGSASVTVVNGTGGGGGGVGVGAVAPVGFVAQTSFIPPLGERLIPTLSQFATPNSYQPIAVSDALGQFLPSAAFRARAYTYDGQPSHAHNGGRPLNNALIVKFGHQASGLNYRLPRDPISSTQYGTGRGTSTLGSHVFDRGIYHPGKTIAVHHKVAVLPRNRQNDLYR